MSVWNLALNPALPPKVDLVVNDVTGLNPIPVAAIITPVTTEEIAAALRSHTGPISIGGGRFSQGGQTAEPGALQIDMRQFKRVLALDTVAKTITVQAGARWRDVQEALDPHNLSVKIMQTYANFTVGGSVSVNVHGRYVGQGPLVRSVRSLHVLLADGSLIEASRTRNPDVFAGVVGGYGGLGVITDVTLDLADNLVVERRNEVMPIGAYARYFMEHIRNAPGAVFHNADIYPDGYTTVNATTFWTTRSAPTIHERLVSTNRSYRLNRVVYWIISEAPAGKWVRQHVIDPIIFRSHPVVWRNHEASYDVAELEPSSRTATTYVLQEYFVPVARFDSFVPAMRTVFQRHRVNVINVSIRHALPDSVSLLAWAPREVFAFVVYYKQRTDQTARDSVRVWTRELLDSVLAVGGTYYLPYQPQATPAQFAQAYPRAEKFFALKRRLDPTNKFRNLLWDTYDPEDRSDRSGSTAPRFRRDARAAPWLPSARIRHFSSTPRVVHRLQLGRVRATLGRQTSFDVSVRRLDRTVLADLRAGDQGGERLSDELGLSGHALGHRYQLLRRAQPQGAVRGHHWVDLRVDGRRPADTGGGSRRGGRGGLCTIHSRPAVV